MSFELSPEHEKGALRVAALLISYYGTENMSSCDHAAPTITTRDRLGLVTVMVTGTPCVIVDIRLRMLQPANFTGLWAGRTASSRTAPTANRKLPRDGINPLSKYIRD